LVLGWRVCDPEQDGLVSHGLCQACYEIERAALADRLVHPERAMAAAEALAAEWILPTPKNAPPFTHKADPKTP
jgi:hypothetical protein